MGWGWDRTGRVMRFIFLLFSYLFIAVDYIEVAAAARLLP